MMSMIHLKIINCPLHYTKLTANSGDAEDLQPAPGWCDPVQPQRCLPGAQEVGAEKGSVVRGLA